MEATNFERSTVLTESSLIRKRPLRNSLKRCVLLGTVAHSNGSYCLGQEEPTRGSGHDEDEIGLGPEDYLQVADEEEDALVQEERALLSGRGFIADEAIDAGDLDDEPDVLLPKTKKERKKRKKATAKTTKNLPPLYYLAGFHRKSARIRNLIPLGAAILQQSKVIFLNKTRILITCLDPKSAEVAYMDTGKRFKSVLKKCYSHYFAITTVQLSDSIYVSLETPKLDDIVLPAKQQLWSRSKLFVEPGKIRLGALKKEGFYRFGLIRQIKVYSLVGLLSHEDLVKWPECLQEPVDLEETEGHRRTDRCKGVENRTRAILPLECFGQNELDLRIKRRTIAPEQGLEIYVSSSRQKFPHAVNDKRFSDGLHSFCL